VAARVVQDGLEDMRLNTKLGHAGSHRAPDVV
jgi:hypothetical protein